MNDALAAKLEYWRTWNIPRCDGIRESAGDQAARELAQLCTVEIGALAARVAELEREVALYKPVYVTEQIRRMPALGTGSASTCGCSSWTDGLGNGGEYKCYLHMPKQPPADGEKQE